MRGFPNLPAWMLLGAALLSTDARAATDDYARCVSLTRSKPAEAEVLAKRMIRAKNEISGRHCLAMSAFARRDYDRAGRELDTLAKRASGQKALLADVLQQAGTAWENAGRPESAVRRYTDALALAFESGKPARQRELLLARARVYTGQKQHLKALQDLDNVLSTAPNDAAVLVMRARILIALDQPRLAADDVTRALRLDPRNAKARSLREKLKG